MTDSDRLLSALAAQPAPALETFEPQVWRRIERERETAGLARLPWAAAAMAVLIGAGVATADRAWIEDSAAPRDAMAVFSTDAPLAPSTLLAHCS